MLSDIIHAHIKAHGFMRVDEYMQLCLLHPEHGYYTNRTVFGAEGDFTTAPEVSQLFGEMLGIWAVLQWQYLGSPTQINIIELGPGRGTLMRDLLRATNHVAPFQKAMHIHMVEASPQLQQKQRQNLLHIAQPILWHGSLDTLPFDKPAIILANEFFDALPIRQLIVKNGAWHERVIVADGDNLAWGTIAFDDASQHDLPDPATCRDNDIIELFPLGEELFKQCCEHLRMTNGVMAVIDYGDHIVPRIGDTLQALHKHQKISVFEKPGESDITAHVDFHRMQHLAHDVGLLTEFAPQRQFLKDCGIDIRFQSLQGKCTDDAARDTLRTGYDRLINPHAMGHLFKVLTVKTA
jgi:NADH dehydrogenase [ubiquinone] 1 alpha subcomplex assembly factor 7